MKIYPAIDILNGKPNMLYQGDYQKATQVAEDVLKTAQNFIKDGATHIHFVDLDGAKKGEPVNNKLILDAIKATDIDAQVGGGIRSLNDITTYIENGAKKVIIGTKAIDDIEFLKSIIKKYKEQIIVAADSKNGFIKTNGWITDTKIELFKFIENMTNIGVEEFIVTDISKDGAMSGIDKDFYKKIVQSTSAKIIASGGVKDVKDIMALKTTGVDAVVIGTAIYNKSIDLKDAIEQAKI